MNFSRDNTNIWAPWRMEYIETIDTGETDCFLCDYIATPERDEENLLLWRGKTTYCLLNRFPYTGGHCLIAPYDHLGDLPDFAPEVISEMMAMTQDLEQSLRVAIGAEGFNIGINLGRCAGAGLPGHLHTHIVPRWSGDTNFMSTLGDARVVPEFLLTTRRKILAAAATLDLSTFPGA
ncbi:MAG: HIT domain-containing protein [Phycisphaerales bacterium]|jgi:ATP adenylyltransferase|nr:HIT domain-containing protein [Phycisphaerales bacterium]MBT7171696.1 HIT domain-containing protein [Phycisphaerales bacterium]